jgi:euchromatic histone-lysine N-methyltransferase
VQVFKTTNKGWGVRSWDYIPAGAPICEYVGTIRHNDDRLESMLDNMYIFELDMLQTMWGMEGRQVRRLKIPHLFVTYSTSVVFICLLKCASSLYCIS